MQSVRPIANRWGHSEGVRITARLWSRIGVTNRTTEMVAHFQVLLSVQILRHAAVRERVCASTTMRQHCPGLPVVASLGRAEMGGRFGR